MSRVDRALAHVRDRAKTAARVHHDHSASVDFERARVTVNFHPDRRLASGMTVAEGLLLDGVYKSQFETGVSSGSRTAFAGGERDRWEEALFGGAYHEPPASADERPIYGALDLWNRADGASPRFGSCFLVLRAHVAARCTFSWGDSHLGPEHVGTADAIEAVLAAVRATLEARGEAFDPSVARRAADATVGRALDEYVEAQVHGGVVLARDAAALVVDPSFEGSPTGAVLHELARRHGLSFRRHPGFVLAAKDVPADFRGPAVAALARHVARQHVDADGREPRLDARLLGLAAARASTDEELQQLKQLWHVLVRFGQPYVLACPVR